MIKIVFAGLGLSFSALYALSIIFLQIIGISWVDDPSHYYISGAIALLFAAISWFAFPKVKGYWWTLCPLFFPMGFVLLFSLETLLLQPTLGAE